MKKGVRKGPTWLELQVLTLLGVPSVEIYYDAFSTRRVYPLVYTSQTPGNLVFLPKSHVWS